MPPLMVRTEKNPAGLPIEGFDGFQNSYLENGGQFYREVVKAI